MCVLTDELERAKRKPLNPNVYELFYLSPELFCECNGRMFYRSVCNLQINEDNRETQGRTHFKKSKPQMKMNIFKIKISDWDEFNFILATQLSEKQIRSVIQPMVDESREEDFVFTPDDYVNVLKDAYPKAVILTDNSDTDEIVF